MFDILLIKSSVLKIVCRRVAPLDVCVVVVAAS